MITVISFGKYYYFENLQQKQAFMNVLHIILKLFQKSYI
jgi:hypothetical protein